MERKNRGILKNKLFLYLTEFFSGMSVMAVELGASRLLAPYFSSSQIVWTIIIGTIMIAMALGNIYGGRTADKSPNPDKLYGRIIVAALWIALIPVVGKYIIVGISAVLIFSVNNNFLILAAFVACMVIFVFPLFLLGTGTYATQCRKYFGDMNIEGVEIDEKITDLSRKYFSLSEDVPVTTYDGRAFLNASQKAYDVIMVDAYQDITIPFQMSSKEFFALVKSHLKDDGVMVVNMNMRGTKEGNINQYLSDTIGSVFTTEVIVDVAGSSNRELFASDDPDIGKNLTKHTGELTNANLKNMMQEVASNLTEYQKGNYILTDDQAPVELLGMQVIDELIKDEVQYYKDIYKERGIKGLMESL